MTTQPPPSPPPLPRPPRLWIADTARQLYAVLLAAEWHKVDDAPCLRTADLIEIAVDDAWELWDAAATSWEERAGEYVYSEGR